MILWVVLLGFYHIGDDFKMLNFLSFFYPEYKIHRKEVRVVLVRRIKDSTSVIAKIREMSWSSLYHIPRYITMGFNK